MLNKIILVLFIKIYIIQKNEEKRWKEKKTRKYKLTKKMGFSKVTPAMDHDYYEQSVGETKRCTQYSKLNYQKSLGHLN